MSSAAVRVRTVTVTAARKKNVSYMQMLANAANARKATGPRSLEGKARSSQNALKHGFRATNPLLDEDPARVEAAHALFVRSFRPRNAAAKAAVDLAFRALRRLERMYGAEDARILLEQEKLETRLNRDRTRFVERGRTEFEVDPAAGFAALASAEPGLDVLVAVLGELGRDARNGLWTPTHSARLLAIEEEGTTADPRLDEVVKQVDTIAKARAALNGSTPDDRIAAAPRSVASRDLDNARAVLGRIMPALLGRLDAARSRLENTRLEIRLRERRDVRLLMDDRKVDDSPETVLFERYKSQALREFHRAVDLAVKLCGYKPGEIETPLSVHDDALDPIIRHANRVVEAKWAPNEPKSEEEGRDDRRDGEAPSTDVRGPSDR